MKLTPEELFKYICEVTIDRAMYDYTELVSIPDASRQYDITQYQVRKAMKELVNKGLIKSDYESCYNESSEKYSIARGYRLTKAGYQTDEYKAADEANKKEVLNLSYHQEEAQP